MGIGGWKRGKNGFCFKNSIICVEHLCTGTFCHLPGTLRHLPPPSWYPPGSFRHLPGSFLHLPPPSVGAGIARRVVLRWHEGKALCRWHTRALTAARVVWHSGHYFRSSLDTLGAIGLRRGCRSTAAWHLEEWRQDTDERQLLATVERRAVAQCATRCQAWSMAAWPELVALAKVRNRIISKRVSFAC